MKIIIYHTADIHIKDSAKDIKVQKDKEFQYIIEQLTKFIADDIRSPVGQVASSLVPYLCGCVVQQEEILLVLDALHILRSDILGIN